MPWVKSGDIEYWAASTPVSRFDRPPVGGRPRPSCYAPGPVACMALFEKIKLHKLINCAANYDRTPALTAAQPIFCMMDISFFA
ncbi:hypothetical protein R69927_00083 [Paraburkholderia domus]|jgi:hypothetical protein|uniref:Uncharacterized protein n=1 Tax=Paraburkholderia domus TaxID=2793075 RepID=A0A9N8QTI0_9BURK|nr:hypothetical protein R70006_00083 [Paraburkholderia domus]CAE6777292.1 hypothetical protein R69749_01518 [Paraburkholderia domus]CAE6798409.1 hypothetical protein R75483_05225 [Paraburkholderia domus]CAE6808810.1 hypothetical protein R69927_00083 [Paraburkholderia domus]CAE6854378.1 hypothetical protein R70211_00083 [Paraburkholderia domus]